MLEAILLPLQAILNYTMVFFAIIIAIGTLSALLIGFVYVILYNMCN